MPTAPHTYAEQQAAILKGLAKQAEGYTPATLAELVAPQKEISASIVFITPDIALDILAKHHAPNRAMSVASKDAYLADMIRGRWELNGETIAFDVRGKLIQGQHRMAALAETAKRLPGFPGLPFVAVFGLPTKAQETMDAGRKRSVADQLNIGQTAEGKIGTKIVSALRALYLLSNAGSGGKLGGGKLTNALLMDMFKHHKDIVKSVEAVYAKGDAELTISVRPAVVTAIHYIATNLLEGMADKAENFIEVLRTGVPTEGYEGTDPAHALYTRWNQMLATGKRPSENDALKLIALAWALYAEGKAATSKAFVKVPVVLEPIGITRTDVTGEVVDPITSSQPEATGVNPGKPVETVEQKAARYNAAAEATIATLAAKKAARAKGGNKPAEAKAPAKGKPNAADEAPKADNEATKEAEAPAA